MLEFFVNLLIFILVFFFFIFIFSIILYFIFKVFFKIKNKTKTINFKTIFKNLALFLLPVYLLLFLAGGCSYKYMDPQYYEFESLCYLNAGKVLIGNEPKNFIYGDHIIHKQINKSIKEISFQKFYNNQLVFYQNDTYLYDNYGIFLEGDEGAGFYFGYMEILSCKDIDKKFKSIMSLR
ncbi:hypothetical protein [Campylobacter cuniculorum]|uniref:Uncharacterized protein n=2 Tax=Campylobacter cuniculorum TaxID=374106 RepID=A0A1W6BVK8_9BACT|nr:hypothetical protein [Campylobacter cuniculorum]ARJ56095.1 hypothetical protein CCUN_0448 [Campylobacter cuniculorum DSM 23162 = LMG 24588]QOR05345.1 hypothetical protein A0071_05115 [Campylobacter cuniculorum]